MDTHEGAVFYRRVVPTSISRLLVVTFILGLCAGMSLSSVVAGTDHVMTVDASPWLPPADHDMSTAAYEATHPMSIWVLPAAGQDMSAAAYEAIHANPN